MVLGTCSAGRTPHLQHPAFGCSNGLGSLVGSAVQVGPVGGMQHEVKVGLWGPLPPPRPTPGQDN